VLPKERQNFAKEDFSYWFNRATEFLLDFENTFNRKSYSQAAFMLHQAAENLYNTVLLVLTRYKPNTHDLKKLSSRVTSVAPTFLQIFPQGTEEEKRFELLRKAYVDARYNRNYIITEDELTWLAERVKILQGMVQEICQKKIASFE